MSLLALTAATLFTPLEEIRAGVVVIEDGVIREAGSREAVRLPPGAREINFGQRILAPGFIDIHIHGGMGRDVMESAPPGGAINRARGEANDALDTVARSILQSGTTSFLATTISAKPDELCRVLASLREAITSWPQASSEPRAEPLGIHMEGPFISVDCRGVHPQESLQACSLELFQRYAEAAGEAGRVLTLAPELEGARELQRAAQARGWRVALGHSNGSYDAARAAAEAGATHAVHTFNAMRPFSHRDPGILGEVLTDERLFAEVIADGVHVSPPALRLLLVAKGAAKIILVTDAVSATGMCPGRYLLGGMEIVLGDDPQTGLPCCRNAEGKLAGSVLTQDRAVRNMAALAGARLQDAVRMATWNPALLLGIERRKGSLHPGADADLVVLEPDGRLAGVISHGRADFL